MIAKISNSARVTPSATQTSTHNTKTGGRPSPRPIGAAPYSIINVLVMSARVEGRGIVKRNAMVRGKTTTRTSALMIAPSRGTR